MHYQSFKIRSIAGPNNLGGLIIITPTISDVKKPTTVWADALENNFEI